MANLYNIPEYAILEFGQIIFGIISYRRKIAENDWSDHGIGIILLTIFTKENGYLSGGEVVNPIMGSPNYNCILFFDEFLEKLYIIYSIENYYHSIDIKQVLNLLQNQHVFSNIPKEDWDNTLSSISDIEKLLSQIFHKMYEHRRAH